MPILNYTTTIAVEKTLGEIQGILARHGIKSISLEYSKGIPTGLTFVIPTQFGDRQFRLPANLGGIQKTLQRQYQEGRVAPRFATPEHAARVAWRILKDWIAAQMAIVEAGMVRLDEVMLPYLLADDGRTLYVTLVEHELRLLPERTPA